MSLSTLLGYSRVRSSPTLGLQPKPKIIIRKVEKGIILWRVDGVQEAADEDERHSWYNEQQSEGEWRTWSKHCRRKWACLDDGRNLESRPVARPRAGDEGGPTPCSEYSLQNSPRISLICSGFMSRLARISSVEATSIKFLEVYYPFPNMVSARQSLGRQSGQCGPNLRLGGGVFFVNPIYRAT